MRRKRILIGILTIIALGLFGAVSYGWWLAGPRQIIITTNKKEYQLGESVEITVKSDSLRPIYYRDGPLEGCPDSKIPGCIIVSKSRPYAFYTFGSFSCSTEVGKYIKINPNKEFSAQWDQKLNEYLFTGLHSQTAGEGIYRIECKYATHKYNCLLLPKMEWYCIFRNPFFKYLTFYSSDFTIKRSND
jgi:hypothetical protein